MNNPQDIKSVLSFPKDIVIISHRNPDGDAIGSSLGLKHFLLRHGHAVKVVVPSDYPDNFSWMPAVDDILVYELEHLIKVLVALHRAGLAPVLPSAKEVHGWKRALLERFDDHSTEWQGTEKGFDSVRLHYVETFDDLISISG